jgi:hypothetical protein
MNVPPLAALQRIWPRPLRSESRDKTGIAAAFFIPPGRKQPAASTKRAAFGPAQEHGSVLIGQRRV